MNVFSHYTPRWSILPSLNLFHSITFISNELINCNGHRNRISSTDNFFSSLRRHQHVTRTLIKPLAQYPPGNLSDPSFEKVFPHLSNSVQYTIQIKPGETHIWWLIPPALLSASHPSLLDTCTSLLDSKELHECNLSKNEHSKNLRILARAFTRSVLTRYIAPSASDASPRSLIFNRNSYGKPELVQSNDHTENALQFNVTHTDGLIGLAVTRGNAVGIDAESLLRTTRTNPLKVAQRRFSNVEIRQLEESRDGEERATLFIKLWTLKESYVKATGKGIDAAPGLKGFGFSLSARRGNGDDRGGDDSIENGCLDIKFSSLLDINGTDSHKSDDDGTMTHGDDGTMTPMTPKNGSCDASWGFLLMQPTKDHIAALCYKVPGSQCSERSTTKTTMDPGGLSVGEVDSVCEDESVLHGIENQHIKVFCINFDGTGETQRGGCTVLGMSPYNTKNLGV